MKILLTGGAGHIGSVVANSICKNNDVVIIDDLSCGFKQLINPRAQFYKGSIMDINFLDNIFSKNKFDVVIHFAAKIIISESVTNPNLYHDVNTKGTINILNCMKQYGCKNIIFASSAAVYGEPKMEILSEESEKKPCSPYGESKLNAENAILNSGLNYYVLRFFNVGGASKNNKYGCMKDKPTLLIALVNKRLLNNQVPLLFGDDYETKDGSALRDYIHVEDIARIVKKCLIKIRNNKVISNVFNVGTGKGYTVIEVIKEGCKVNKKPFKYSIEPRRPGDPTKLIANCSKAKKIMHWKSKYNLHSMVKTDYKFQKTIS